MLISKPITFLFGILAILQALCWSSSFAQVVKSTEGLEPIGGKWFVRPGDKPVYLYRDGDELVDLFSYHAQDSNKDGIDNLRISHDKQHLIIQSQGYPNHPTAISQTAVTRTESQSKTLPFVYRLNQSSPVK